MMGIFSLGSELLKTVGHWAVGLGLAKIWQKNGIEKGILDQNQTPYLSYKNQYFGRHYAK